MDSREVWQACGDAESRVADTILLEQQYHKFDDHDESSVALTADVYVKISISWAFGPVRRKSGFRDVDPTLPRACLRLGAVDKIISSFGLA